MNPVFTPITLKNITFKNRIVRSATNTAMGNIDGSISDKEMIMYEKLARNQIGLIITGHCYVNPIGQTKPQQTSMYHDKHIKRLTELTELVHNNGSKIFAQISHGGANVHVPDFPVAPSKMVTPGGKIAEELSLSDIDAVVNDFVDAALRAKKSGFDGIQIHMAHGFLLCQFVSYGTNNRTDNYGGSAENRLRIVVRIINGIKKSCGIDYPVIVKVNSNSYLNNKSYVEDMDYFMSKFLELGVDAVEVSGFDFASRSKEEHNYFLEAVKKLKSKTMIPIILVGGIRNLADMEYVIDEGMDMVSMGRPFIAEPDLITRLIHGQKTSKCISCSHCFGLFLREKRRCILDSIRD
ncbi:oxidoreductase [Anaerobium acetethylicum]|uniref:2,4-dienoyl-CoA reductase n=1 Tax=Anaerobium acetethylicum TaxID=1619234 RepID=A0A1D3TW50_9FIRM|nr:NADH:flavin oxidoreductase [Anaerobium acetethylicum]SCP98420.1 2,4-dienoyl-CoA reductase [Anaerobium acetethylicum]